MQHLPVENPSVVKFGGTSLASTELIKKCAAKVAKSHQGSIIVVSGMGNITDLLQEKVDQFNGFSNVSRDMVLASGEQISAGLFALALEELGIKSCPLCGWQVPIITQDKKIISVSTVRLITLLQDGITPVVTGFQGVENQAITTLTRGGSDVTALSISSALGWDCFIYTDVDGVYTGDPNKFTTTKLETISYDVMLDLSLNGAKVLHSDAARIAKENRVKVFIKSSFSESSGTEIGVV